MPYPQEEAMACDLPWNVRAALHAVWRAVRGTAAVGHATDSLKPLELRTLRLMDPRLCVLITTFGEWRLVQQRHGATAQAQAAELVELVEHICRQITGEDTPPPWGSTAVPQQPTRNVPQAVAKAKAKAIARAIAADFPADREAGADIIDFRARAAGEHLDRD